jgi:hypothetical protein
LATAEGNVAEELQLELELAGLKYDLVHNHLNDEIRKAALLTRLSDLMAIYEDTYSKALSVYRNATPGSPEHEQAQQMLGAFSELYTPTALNLSDELTALPAPAFINFGSRAEYNADTCLIVKGAEGEGWLQIKSGAYPPKLHVEPSDNPTDEELEAVINDLGKATRYRVDIVDGVVKLTMDNLQSTGYVVAADSQDKLQVYSCLPGDPIVGDRILTNYEVLPIVARELSKVKGLPEDLAPKLYKARGGYDESHLKPKHLRLIGAALAAQVGRRIISPDQLKERFEDRENEAMQLLGRVSVAA